MKLLISYSLKPGWLLMIGCTLGLDFVTLGFISLDFVFCLVGHLGINAILVASLFN